MISEEYIQKAKEQRELQIKHMFDPDKSCVNYRFVVNDAICWPWEPMPEAGTNLKSLVEYLKTCEHNCDRLGKRWNYKRLLGCRAWDSHIIDYGLRSQFWIPEIPTEKDFEWINEDTSSMIIKCPCGEEVCPSEEYEERMMCPDVGWIVSCRCGRHTATKSGSLSATAEEAMEKFTKLFIESERDDMT